MNNLEIIKIVKTYTKLELLYSVLTGLLFYLLLGALFITPMVVTLLLYIPFMEYFLLAIYIYMSFVGVYFFRMVVRTLKTYNDPLDIDFNKFEVRASTTLAVITFIIIFIIYYYLH